MVSNIIIADKKLDKATNLFNYLQNNNSYINIIGLITNEENLIKYLESFKVDVLIINLNIIKNIKKLLNILNNINIEIIVLIDDIEKINKFNINLVKGINCFYTEPFNVEKLNISLKKICKRKSNFDIKKKLILNYLILILINLALDIHI